MNDIPLHPAEYELLRRFIRERVGIALSDGKQSLVKGRLNKRLHQLGLPSFRAYYDHLAGDTTGDELAFFTSAVSTNVTSFFRETAQWKWLDTNFERLIRTKGQKKIRIWSAGCSSGEEPYSILMFLHSRLDDFDSWDIKILATDISRKVLAKAIDGRYASEVLANIPRPVLERTCRRLGEGSSEWQIRPQLREKVMFRLYNLVTDPFIFRTTFDMVFCRNVMIYFDDTTRHAVVERFSRVLSAGSPLFLGSSESLTTQRDKFALLGSSIYERQ